jgi:hypothetical protein
MGHAHVIPPRSAKDPEPSWGRVEAVAHLAKRTRGEILGAVLSGKVRTQRIRGSLFVAVEDALELAAEAPAPAPTPPLVRRVEDRRRRRAAAPELPLRYDGGEAEGGDAL